MTKGNAIRQWLGGAVHNYEIPVVNGAAMDPVPTGARLPAYPSTAVPENAALPYLTYDLAFGAWGEGEVSITVNLWFRTGAEDIPNAAVREFSAYIGFGDTISCDGGMIWFKRGSPFAQAVPDPDTTLKRRCINISAEFLTAD